MVHSLSFQFFDSSATVGVARTLIQSIGTTRIGVKWNRLCSLVSHNVFHSIPRTQCGTLTWPLGEDSQTMSSRCLTYLLSDFGFLFLIKEGLPIISFVSLCIVCYFWIFRKCVYLFIISTPWREVTCWRPLGATGSDCLCSVPALTCDLYSHHVLHGASSSVKQSSSWQLSREWQHFYEVTPYYMTLVYSAQGEVTLYTILRMWTVPNETDLHPCRLFFFKCLETIF